MMNERSTVFNARELRTTILLKSAGTTGALVPWKHSRNLPFITSTSRLSIFLLLVFRKAVFVVCFSSCIPRLSTQACRHVGIGQGNGALGPGKPLLLRAVLPYSVYCILH